MFSSQITSDTFFKTKILTLTYTDPITPDKNISISVAPEFGSNLFSFKSGKNNLIYCDKELLKDRDWTGCFVLWPLPNRVRGKKYEFEGNTVSLHDIKRKKGNDVLIHGLVDDKSWNFNQPEISVDHISVRTFIRVTTNMRKYFPFEGQLSLQYTVDKNSVRIDYTVENSGKTTMPFGFALHPYFRILSGLHNTKICVPAQSVMEADEELLPTGKLILVKNTEFDLCTPHPVKNLHLDHVFTDLISNTAYIDYPGQHLRLYITSSPDFTHMVVYTQEKENGYICLENQTGSTDMINLYTRAEKEQNKELKKAAHLLTLSPGKTHSGYIRYSVQYF